MQFWGWGHPLAAQRVSGQLYLMGRMWVLVQLHCPEGEEDGPGLGTHARPIQLRTGSGVRRPGSFLGGGEGEEGRSVQCPLLWGLQGVFNPDSSQIPGRKCELWPPCSCLGLVPPEHTVCVCEITVIESPDCNIIFGPCRDSIIHLHKQIAQTH